MNERLEKSSRGVTEEQENHQKADNGGGNSWKKILFALTVIPTIAYLIRYK